MPLSKNCEKCNQNFSVTDSDLAFYDKASPVIAGEKFSIPAPKLCPDCRMQRRILFRNFFNIYHGKSSLSNKHMLSMYKDGQPFPVYSNEEWWSDKLDALEYGLEPNHKESPLANIEKLHRSVPRCNLMQTMCENSDYCNFAFQIKNSYLVFGHVIAEDCCYGHIVWQSQNCFDCLYTYRSELCYECVDCVQCYNVAFAVDVENCIDCRFLINCSGCKNCFGCVGLKGEEYHIFNEPVKKSEYAQKVKELEQYSKANIQATWKKLKAMQHDLIVKNYHGFGCEDVTGDYLYFCTQTYDSYDVKNGENCKYAATADKNIDCYDFNFSGPGNELCYNCLTIMGYGLICCHTCIGDSANLYYCEFCHACKNCFGCVGLKNQSFCIFNKQYSEDDYYVEVKKLISNMQERGEWGEFFPYHFSPFGYNETMAYEYFPLSEEEALKQSFRWTAKEEKEYQKVDFVVPEAIQEVDDSICNELLACTSCGKNYKIISKELQFYRQKGYPAPSLCFNCRHSARMKLRNPRRLWDRQCNKCGISIQSTYAPERSERVYCEECYLKEIY